MDLQAIAAELYGLAPEEFTAARNARVKQAKADGETDLAGDIQGLRKPTVGAWLLNQLVRQHREEIDQLFELGTQLRAAQGTLGAAELRALGEQRRRLTRAVAEQAAGIGHEDGRKISAQVVAAVEETLRSAMVDAAAGEALATGLLVDTFSSTGLEPVDVAAVVAVAGAVDSGSRPASRSGGSGSAASKTSTAARRRKEVAITEARRSLEEAERTAEDARRDCESVRARAVEAGRRREDLESELGELRRRVEELEGRVSAAADTESALRRDQVAATRAERSAVESLDRARRRLQALLDDGDA